MAGDREQIKVQGVHVDRKFAGGLHRVGMEIDVRIRGDTSNFFERLHRAQLIVRVHHGD